MSQNFTKLKVSNALTVFLLEERGWRPNESVETYSLSACDFKANPPETFYTVKVSIGPIARLLAIRGLFPEDQEQTYLPFIID